MVTPVLAILGPLHNSDGTPARQNGGTLIERMEQMASVEHSVEVGLRLVTARAARKHSAGNCYSRLKLRANKCASVARRAHRCGR